MRNFYINTKLSYLSLPASAEPPEPRIFSQGYPWFHLTPPLLQRLAAILGLEDARIDRLFQQVRRHAPEAAEFCRRLRQPPPPPVETERYLAICPICDGVHYPRPDERELACPACRLRQEKRRAREPSPKVLQDRAEDAAARRYILENDPGAFREGVLSPNWKINASRRIERDWERALNRVLMGRAYRVVAREFECSVGLLHKKVRELMARENRESWQDN